MALNKDWKDLPTTLAPAVGETLFDWHARINAYAAANPGALTFLSAAAMEDVETRAQAELDTKAAVLGAPNTYTANRTLALVDGGKVVEINSATTAAVTVPTNTVVPFSVGTQIIIRQMGAGEVSVTGGTGVTVRARGGALRLAAQYAESVLTKRAAEEWVLSGDTIV